MNTYPLSAERSLTDALVAALFVLCGFLVAQSVAAYWRMPAVQTVPSGGLSEEGGMPGASVSSSTQGLSPEDTATSTRQSLNWAGYVARSGSYSAVSGSWIVPQVDTSGNKTPAADATWVGIGGVSAPDLIQAGTQAISDASGDVIYQSWIETIPGNSTIVPIDVNPGDKVTVSIQNESGDSWLVHLTDDTTSQSYATTLTHHSSLSSAEWIQEMPSSAVGDFFIPLDTFGLVSFTDGSTVDGGTTKSVAQSGALPLTMTNMLGDVLAETSTLGEDGASFSVARTTASADIAARRQGFRIIYYFTRSLSPGS